MRATQNRFRHLVDRFVVGSWILLNLAFISVMGYLLAYQKRPLCSAIAPFHFEYQRIHNPVFYCCKTTLSNEANPMNYFWLEVGLWVVNISVTPRIISKLLENLDLENWRMDSRDIADLKPDNASPTTLEEYINNFGLAKTDPNHSSAVLIGLMRDYGSIGTHIFKDGISKECVILEGVACIDNILDNIEQCVGFTYIALAPQLFRLVKQAIVDRDSLKNITI